jgi:cellulose synthase operon protein YhjQ
MQVTLCGLRGGVGTTSISAMLADALSSMGESVLLIDLNPSDLLRLHFNIPYADVYGWGFAQAQQRSWQEHSYEVKDNLYLLPFGRNGLASLGQAMHHLAFAITPWQYADLAAAAGCSWVIYDVPAHDERYRALCQHSDLNLLVTHADAASHILLGQYPLTQCTHILVNQLNVKQRVSDAVLLDWNIRYGTHLVPVSIREDLHVAEAFAHKMPATTYFPNASSSHDVLSLATWCVLQRGAPR